MTKRLIILFSVGVAVGALITSCIMRMRRKELPEDLAGETRPIINK